MMLKKNLTIITLIFFNIFLYSQTRSAKDLVSEISNKNFTMSELVSYANENLTDSIDKAKFFYYWIGSNIMYDKELYQKHSDSSYNYEDDYSYNFEPSSIFEKKLAVCSGYSNLFNWFMEQLGIESVIIIGHIRNERNHYVELESDSSFGHAWNAIKINGRWMIVDTTWGMSSNPVVSDFYFDIAPEKAIITHYPEEESWQLLENPLSLEKFNNSKYIKSIWFIVGFSDIPKLKKDDNYYYFVFRSNPDRKWSVKLLFSIDNMNFQPVQNIKTIIQDGYTFLKFDKSQMPKTTFFKVNLIELYYDGFSSSSLIYEDIINPFSG